VLAPQSLDREKFAIYSHRVKTQKKDLLARNQKVLKRHKKWRIDYRCAIAIGKSLNNLVYQTNLKSNLKSEKSFTAEK